MTINYQVVEPACKRKDIPTTALADNPDNSFADNIFTRLPDNFEPLTQNIKPNNH